MKRGDKSRTAACWVHTDDEEVRGRRLDARDKLRKQREEAAAQRVALARSVMPTMPSTRQEIHDVRFRLARLVLERKVTPREAGAVRDLLRDMVASQYMPAG